MQNIEKLTDQVLLQNTQALAQKEKSCALDLLEHLLQIDNRKLYATLGYDCLFRYVVRELGFSESVAYERIRATRLVRRVPGAKDFLKSGALNLTNAAKLESFRRQESLSEEELTKLVSECVGKTGHELEKLLLSKSKNPIPKDRTRQITEELQEARIVLTPELQALILRYEELHGKKPLSSILKDLLSAYLKRKDPVASSQEVKPEGEAETAKPRVTKERVSKVESPPIQVEKEKPVARSRAIPQEIRRQVWQRSQGRCEWRSAVTGLRCTSRYRLQLDHFPVPFALGGSHSLSNLRHACPAHNARFAIEVFGITKWGETRWEAKKPSLNGSRRLSSYSAFS